MPCSSECFAWRSRRDRLEETFTNTLGMYHVMSTAGSRGRRRPNERRRRPAVTSHVYRMCGHLDAPFAFVSRARNVTVRFHSDHEQQASGFSIGYVTYSRTYSSAVAVRCSGHKKCRQIEFVQHSVLSIVFCIFLLSPDFFFKGRFVQKSVSVL